MKKTITLTLMLTCLVMAIQAQNFGWAKKIGGTNIDVITSMTTDNAGNIYVAGGFYGIMDADPGAGIDLHTSSGNGRDIFFAKYDSSGNYIWAKSLEGTPDVNSWDQATDITVDATGNVYISGVFAYEVDFDPGVGNATLTRSTPPAENLFFAKYDSGGNYIWARNVGRKSYSSDKVNVDVDQTGNVYLSGYISGTGDFDPDTSTASITASLNDMFIAKYTSGGVFTWVKDITGSGASVTGYSLKLNQAGDILVAGYFSGFADFDPSPASALVNGNSGNAFFAKYDDAGNYQWVKNIDGASNMIYDIELDNSGNIYTAGSLWGTADFDPDFSATASQTTTIADNFYAKYDASGNYIYAKLIRGGANSVAYLAPTLSADATGNIYIAGDFTGTGDFDPGPAVLNFTSTPSSASPNSFIGLLDVSGNLVWINKLEAEHAASVLAGSSNEVYLSGTFSNTCDFDFTGLVNSLTSSGSSDAFITKYRSTISGIDQLSENNLFSIYPNPAGNYIYLKMKDSNIQNSYVTIFNSNGAEIISETIGSESLLPLYLPSGVYIVKVTSKQKTYTQKLVIN